MLLCYVTDRHLLGRELPSGTASSNHLLKQIERAATAGIDWVQIREKDLTARELLELTRRAIAVVSTAANSRPQPNTPMNVVTRVLVNDRIDVAIAAGAAGVHLGGGSVPIREVVRWCRAGNAPPDFLVGASCHGLDEIIEAERAGANYIFFGPVYETPSKISFGKPQSTEKLAEACRRVGVSVLAIGGVNDENASACLGAGAAGIAAIRLFQEPADDATLRGIVRRLRAIP
ncbi:MAG TPA: thiamine phosphate synthase [Candidatus Acidoferrales bacterium]|nr:thiamine phosphate synthase [Candidatus Acidoferrales bacterium]